VPKVDPADTAGLLASAALVEEEEDTGPDLSQHPEAAFSVPSVTFPKSPLEADLLPDPALD
jgi:hypothetical protein